MALTKSSKTATETDVITVQKNPEVTTLNEKKNTKKASNPATESTSANGSQPPQTPAPAIPDSAKILAAIGERGKDPELIYADIDTITARIGGTVNALSLDKNTAVYFDHKAQRTTLLDANNLSGILALCGVDGSGNPASIATLKQITKYAKIFRKPRMAQTVEPDPNQTTLFEISGKEVEI